MSMSQETTEKVKGLYYINEAKGKKEAKETPQPSAMHDQSFIPSYITGKASHEQISGSNGENVNTV